MASKWKNSDGDLTNKMNDQREYEEYERRKIGLAERNKKRDNDLNPVHYHILKTAKQNGGIYNRLDDIAKIERNNSLSSKQKKLQISWNETNLNTLVTKGYLIRKNINIYEISDAALSMQKIKPFVPGKNYVALLKKEKGNFIYRAEIKREYDEKYGKKEAARQMRMTDGMIKNLRDYGYIESTGKGIYKVTDKGKELIFTENTKTPKSNEFKITFFDRNIKEILDADNRIDTTKLENHPKSSALKKRILTLQREGLIKDDIVQPEFYKSLNSMLREREKGIRMKDLSKMQLAVIKDIRKFFNITETQIERYIYSGDHKHAAADIGFLIKHKIIMRDENFGVYILGKKGIEISNAMFPELVRYSTKVNSRKEEVKHDVLIYTAFNEWKKNTEVDGINIIKIENDRDMRKAAGKNGYEDDKALPDLRITYQMPGENFYRIHEIEIDVKYSEKTITEKLSGMGFYGASARSSKTNKADAALENTEIKVQSSNKTLGWYCANAAQALKVANILRKDNTTRVKRAKNIKLYWLDDDGMAHIQRW